MKGDDFKGNAIKLISEYKKNNPGQIKLYNKEESGVYLSPITYGSISSELIGLLAKWRAENQEGFTKHFLVTEESTKSWLENLVMKREDRLLFIVFDKYHKEIGHMGVSSFNFQGGTCEIDNVVRGEKSKQHSVMYQASEVLVEWIKNEINPQAIHLRVLNDNLKALVLYYKMGFTPVSLIPLAKHTGSDYTEWCELNNGSEKIDRFFISMSLK